MAVTTSLLVVQWNLASFNIFLFIWAMFMAVSVATMTHNHNHLPMWKNKWLNILTDWWLTCFYGFPVFAWIPTHNKNHHKLNNREGDYTITYRVSEKNNFLTLISYPTISGYYQQKAIKDHLSDLKKNNKEKFYLCLAQYAVLVVFIGTFLLIDWKKTLLYIVIPQQFSLFSVLIFNYIQHVHADEESEFNHSRNFTGWSNFFLFNNGFHTVHHDKAGTHWSEAPAAHAKVAHLIDPELNQRSFWWYIIKTYALAPFIPSLRDKNRRQERMEKSKLESVSA
jgi:fatty acid desaturase